MTMRGRDPDVPVVGLLDEVGQHALGDLEVGDDAVLHRLDRHDVAWRPTDHLFGLSADRLDPTVQLVDRHDRRLVDDNPLAAGIDAGVLRFPGQWLDRLRIVRKPNEGSTTCSPPRGLRAHGSGARSRAGSPSEIPSFPCAFTQYMASSAACSSESAVDATSGNVATPTEAVRRTLRLSAARNKNSAIFSRIRSPTARGAVAVRVRQHQRKLIAAEPRDDVGLTGAVLNDGRRFPPAPGCRRDGRADR